MISIKDGTMSVKKMSFVAGIVMFLGTVIFLAVFMWMSGKNVFGRRTYDLNIAFADVVGIRDSSAVYMRGYRIGSIKDVDISREQVLVTVEINDEIRIPEDSRAEIHTLNFIGEKAVVILPGVSAIRLQPGVVLQGENKDLVTMATNILEDIRSRIREGRLDKEIEGLKETIAGVRTLVARLNSAASGIDMESINRQMGELGAAGKEAQAFFNQTRGDVSRFADEGEKTMAGLRDTVDNVAAALQQIEGAVMDVRNGHGTLGALATDPEYISNLNKSIEQLTALLEDIRRNPKKYLKFSLF
jgi:phospholipid/cholesterol/gamma-HCH transport system substrate-binding protein